MLEDLRATFMSVEPAFADDEYSPYWQAAGESPRAGAQPVSAVLASMAQRNVVEALGMNPGVAHFASEMVLNLARRSPHWGSQAKECLSLAAKRAIFAAVADPRYTNIPTLLTALTDESALPRYAFTCEAHAAWEVKRPKTVFDCARWIRRLVSDEVGLTRESPRRQRHELPSDFHSRVIAEQTAAYCLDYDSVAAACLVLKYIADQDWANSKPECARIAVATTCEILFGKRYAEACHISVLDEDRGHGSIDHERFRVRVGHGFRSYDECLVAGDYIVTFPPFLAGLVARVCRCGPLRRLGDGLGQANLQMRDQLLERALIGFRLIFPDIRRLALHGAFSTLGVDGCGIDPVLVSQLLGAPMPGLRGPCDYLRTFKSELSSAFGRIWNCLFARAGLPAPSAERALRVESAAISDNSCGIAEHYAALLGRAEAAIDWNTTMATAEAFFRSAVAVRPSLVHGHLGICVRTAPLLSLELIDKFVAGQRRSRWVALLPPVQDLIAKLSEIFPNCVELPYRNGDRWCTFAQLPEPARRGLTREWLWVGTERNGRAIVPNALRHVGASQRVQSSIMGHGPWVLQWNGHASPYPLADILREQQAALGRMYATFGLERIARVLIAKLTKLRETLPEPAAFLGGADPLLCRRDGPFGGSRTKHVIPPLTPIEHVVAHRLSRAIAGAQHEWGVALDFVVALAMDGVPPDHLLRYRRYYDTSCICGVESGAFAFAALVEHEDIGGLSTLLLPLRFQFESEPVAVRLLRKLTAGGPRHQKMTDWLNGDLKELRRAIGGRVTRLLWPQKTRPPIEHDTAYCLLERIALNACVWNSGGLVAAALGGAPVTLNNADPFDVGEIVLGSRELVGVDGESWVGRPAQREEKIAGIQRFRNLMGERLTGATAQPRIAGRPPTLPEGSGGDKLLLRWTAHEWLPVFLKCFSNPHRKAFERSLKEAGLGKCASRMARCLYHRCLRAGVATLSPPFRARPLEWRDLLTSGESFARTAGISAGKVDDLIDFALALYGLQLRPDEGYRLCPGLVVLQPMANDALVHVPDGKTEHARRTISIRSMCPDIELADEIVRRITKRVLGLAPDAANLWPAMSHRQHGRQLADFLKSVDGLEPYDLRHLGCIAALKALTERHPCQWHAMVTQAKQRGHGGPLQGLRIYAGTGIHCATLPSKRIVLEPGVDWTGHDDVLGCAGEQALPILIAAGQMLLDADVAHPVISLFEAARHSTGGAGRPRLLKLLAGATAPGDVTDISLPPLRSLKSGDREILQTFLALRCLEGGLAVALRADAPARWQMLYRFTRRLSCPVSTVRPRSGHSAV